MNSLLKLAILVVAVLHHRTNGLHFVTVGDWGDNLPWGEANQQNISVAINDWCAVENCLFIASTGDNFYSNGVTSATDPRFDTSWRWVYNDTSIADKLWYISLGNHDHGPDDGREQYQIDFGLTEPRWYYPSLWYDVLYTDGTTTLHLFIIESESLKQNKNDPAAQLAWLESTLAGSTGTDWKIAIFHHPPYSAGDHGPTEDTIVNQVLPILLQHGTDLVISGHDHNLQHIVPMVNPTIDYVVSGAGGRSLYRKDLSNEQVLNGLGLDVAHFGFHHGFVAFEFLPTGYTAFFVDESASLTYSYSRSRK